MRTSTCIKGGFAAHVVTAGKAALILSSTLTVVSTTHLTSLRQEYRVEALRHRARSFLHWEYGLLKNYIGLQVLKLRARNP